MKQARVIFWRGVCLWPGLVTPKRIRVRRMNHLLSALWERGR